jgi:hypothetical protein
LLFQKSRRQETPAFISGSNPVQFATRQNKEGKRTMARMNFGYLPKGNPCAQCGKPIATPEWIESGPQRTSYLWHCFACDYQFEAVAFFEDADSEALAA